VGRHTTVVRVDDADPKIVLARVSDVLPLL
jgi:hypothetical protein